MQMMQTEAKHSDETIEDLVSSMTFFVEVKDLNSPQLRSRID